MNNDGQAKAQPSDTEPFGEVIYSYTRKQALADGVQVDVSQTAEQAGFRIPVFMTDTVFNGYVHVPEGMEGYENEDDRLKHILVALHNAIANSKTQQDRLHFRIYVCNNLRGAEIIDLYSVCAAVDIDDPAPSITIMLPHED